MATAEQYASWIVQNQDKKGTPEFNTVAEAYKLARTEAAPTAAPDSPVDQIPGIMPAKRPQTGDIVSSSIIRGAAALAGLPGEALSGLRAARNWAQGTNYPVPKVLPTSKDIIGAVENVSGTPLYRPETTAEKFIASGLEGAAGGGPFGKIGMLAGLVGGLGAEGAGQITNQNPVARMAGGLIGGLGTGAVASRMRPIGTVFRDAMQGVDEATAKAAQRLINQARARGITLTGPEAIAQVRGTASDPLLNIQRVVEQSRGGGPTMASTMAARPEQNRQAFNQVLEKIGPQLDDATAIAPRVQQAATGAIDDARNAGNIAARALYDAAEAKAISASQWNNLVSNPAIANALEQVKANPALRLQNEMPGSVRWLDAAKKLLDEGAKPSISAAPIERISAASSARSASDLRRAVDVDVPEYARARGIVEKNMRDVVEPMQRQPIGQLADAATFQAQRNILFPANPETLTPTLVKQTITQLTRKDPTVARDLTRQFLKTQFDEVTQNLVKGANEFGGARFAATITGNNQQAQNIRAAIESLPNGKETLTGFNKFIQIMEAQGKRQGGGSMTEFNRQITEELSKGGIAGGTASNILSPGRAANAVRDWWERFQYGRNTEEIARIITDPQAVNKMRALAKMDVGNPGAQAIAASIVLTNMPQREAE